MKTSENRIFEWQTPLDNEIIRPASDEQPRIFSISTEVLSDLASRLSAFRVARETPGLPVITTVPPIAAADTLQGRSYSVALNAYDYPVGAISIQMEEGFADFCRSIYYIEPRRTRRVDSRHTMSAPSFEMIKSETAAYVINTAEAEALQSFVNRLTIFPG